MTREQVDRLRRTPAYPFIEAAHYLNMPVSTLRAWCIGQDYKVKGSTRRFQPLIVLDGAKSEGLSFLNLVEAHVLAAIRRTHDIENLFVVDASFFPSSAAVNPGLTIAAQALRVADHIIASQLR